jgi:hypothetical protein
MLPRSENPVYVESDVDSMIEKVNDPKGDVDRNEVKAMLYYLKGISAGNKTLLKVVFILFVCLFSGLSAMFGVAYMANEYAKDFRVRDSQITALDGNVVQVASVESFGDLFDLPTQPMETLAHLKEISCFVDMTSVPEVNGWTQASFKVTSAYKKLDTQVAFFETADMRTIKIDGATKVATVTKDGKSMPIAESAPIEHRRALEDPPKHPTLQRRRLRRGGGAGDAGGSFDGASSNRAGNS